MTRGRKSKILPADVIARLEKFRKEKRMTFPELNRAMNSPFKWATLKGAMEGKPIWEFNHGFIVEWVESHFPAPPVRDFKKEAAGDTPEPQEAAPLHEGRLRS